MATIPTNRAAYQRLDHIHLGKTAPTRKSPASQKEVNQLRNAITCLSEALNSSTDATFRYRVSQAYLLLYKVQAEHKNA